MTYKLSDELEQRIEDARTFGSDVDGERSHHNGPSVEQLAGAPDYIIVGDGGDWRGICERADYQNQRDRVCREILEGYYRCDDTFDSQAAWTEFVSALDMIYCSYNGWDTAQAESMEIDAEDSEAMFEALESFAAIYPGEITAHNGEHYYTDDYADDTLTLAHLDGYNSALPLWWQLDVTETCEIVETTRDDLLAAGFDAAALDAAGKE